MTIDRAALLALDGSRSRRNVPAMFEMRAADSAGDLSRVFRGHACVTGVSYEVYGGAPYGWNEVVQRGAFTKTLSEKPEVVFLVNHVGLSLASTWAGTLTLAEDEIGLGCEARLNPARSDANDFILAVEDDAVREMSFGFRVIRQTWEDDEGNEADSMTGTVRRIMEVSLNKGDVSGVNFGANDATFGSIDRALAELRAGASKMTAEDVALLRSLTTIDQRAADADGDPAACAQAVDAVIDELVDALAAGDSGGAKALADAADLAADALLASLGLTEDDELDTESNSRANRGPSLVVLRARMAPSTRPAAA